MSDVQMLKDAYEAFGKGEIEKVVAVMDDKIEWHEPDVEGISTSGVHHGPDEVVKNVFESIGTDWESFELDAQEWVDGGATVVVLGRTHAVGKKTGEKINVPWAHAWKLRDGKVVRFENYTDTATELNALHDPTKEGYPRRG